jgi:hypothetical protein
MCRYDVMSCILLITIPGISLMYIGIKTIYTQNLTVIAG